MRVKFIGGVQQVTGSCTLLEYSIDNKTCKILVDCGIEQDSQGVKIVDWTFNPKDVDRVILTHAHMDHCGMLPLLYRKGYKGKVFCTATTQDLAMIILKDLAKSGVFAEEEIELISWEAVDDIAKNRKMGQKISLFDSVSCYFLRSSHMLGAAAVGITWSEADRNAPASDDARTHNEHQDGAPVITRESLRTILFSGDVGRVFEGDEMSLHKPNMYPYCSDNDVFLVLETTYGNRLHGENTGYRDKIARLGEIVGSSLNLPDGRAGKLIIPAFSMERTQTIAADLYKVLKETPVFESFKEINLDACKEEKSYPERVRALCKHPEALDDEIAIRDDKNFIKAEFSRIIHIFMVSPMAKRCNAVYRKRLGAMKMQGFEVKYDLFDKTTPTVSSDDEINSFLGIYGQETVRFSSNLICEYANIFTFRNQAELYKPVKNKHLLQATNKKAPKVLTKELERGADYPCVVIAASGMCDQGTVLDCLSLWLPDPDATVLLTGYTSPGSNGDILKRLMRGEFSEEEKYNIEMELGDSSIRLMDIHCRILDMSPYYSGHADCDQLLQYVFDNPVQKRTKPVQIFLNHGNGDGMESIAARIDERNQRLAEKLGIVEAPKTIIPKKEDTNRWYNLTTGEWEERHDDGVDGNIGTIDMPDGYPIRYDYRTKTLNFTADVPIEYVKELHRIFSSE